MSNYNHFYALRTANVSSRKFAALHAFSFTLLFKAVKLDNNFHLKIYNPNFYDSKNVVWYFVKSIHGKWSPLQRKITADDQFDQWNIIVA